MKIENADEIEVEPGKDEEMDIIPQVLFG